jgi:hypothetical protein
MKKKFKSEEISAGVPRHISPERKAYLDLKRKEAEEKAKAEALK